MYIFASETGNKGGKNGASIYESHQSASFYSSLLHSSLLLGLPSMFWTVQTEAAHYFSAQLEEYTKVSSVPSTCRLRSRLARLCDL